MKRIICLIIAVFTLTFLLNSCSDDDNTQQKTITSSEIDGVWQLTEKLDDASGLKAKLLEKGFFENELSFLDTGKIGAVKLLKFSANTADSGTYEYSYDKEGTYVILTVVIEDFLNKCYENFNVISENFGSSVAGTVESFEDFKKLYCSNFSCGSYDELIDKLCGLIFNSTLYEGAVDQGDFKIDGSMIFMTRKVESDYVSLDETTNAAEPEQIGAVIKNNELTLSYKSGTETYTKK